MKKEISDHIANAFLQKKAGKKRDKSFFFIITVTFFILASFVLGIGLFVGPNAKKIPAAGQNILFEKFDGPYVLNFNFEDSTSKLQTLVIDIPKIDLSGYKIYKFSVRLKNAPKKPGASMKVGLVDQRAETSSLYISELNDSWNKVALPLTDFDKIQDWSGLVKLTFTVEEWNIPVKKGELLIEGIEFSKN
jgi:hypothetical protein